MLVIQRQNSTKKAMGHSFPMGGFTRVKSCIKIPYCLSETIHVPGHFARTK